MWITWGRTEAPAPDKAVITSDLACEKRDGVRILTPGEGNDFLTYAEGYLNAK